MKLPIHIENLLKSKKKVLCFLIGIFSLIVASVAFSGHFHHKKQPGQPDRPGQTASAAAPVPVPAPAPVKVLAVDFLSAPLSDVVTFLVELTDYKITCRGFESTVITWKDKGLNQLSLLTSLRPVLADLGLDLVESSPGLFIIQKFPAAKSPVRLDFARTKKGIFFVVGDKIIPKDLFPYFTYLNRGQWFVDLTEDQRKELFPGGVGGGLRALAAASPNIAGTQ